MRFAADEIKHCVGILDLTFQAFRVIVHHLVRTEAPNVIDIFGSRGRDAAQASVTSELNRIGSDVSCSSMDDDRLASFEPGLVEQTLPGRYGDETCIAAGLVGGEGFAVDASLIAADANKQGSIAGQDWHRDRDPKRSSRAVKEYLATLDDTAWGAASEVVPKFVSPSDPAAQWTGAHKGPAFFAYSDNYLIDVKFGVIVDVEASRAIRQAEVGAAKTMIERTEERFGLKPGRLVGDTAYGAAPMLNWLVEEKGIAPHIPVFDKSKRDDGTFSRSDFRYDPTGDVYHCPGGKRLGTSGTVHEGKTLLYRASKLDCDVCPLKPQCCPKEPSRKIPRDIHEHARDVARSFAGTAGFERSRHERKKIEMRFAHLKRILKLGRLRLRGPRGAQDEFVLAAIAQNLRRLASLVARPPPAQALCLA